MAISTGPSKTSGDSGDEEANVVAEINITPLTDIFLVLLIIFMVSSTVMNRSELEVQLPKASEGAKAEPSETDSPPVIITLLPAGGLKVNGKQTLKENLLDSLKETFKVTESRLIILEGDRNAYLGSAIEIMDLGRKAGATQFSIATETSQ